MNQEKTIRVFEHSRLEVSDTGLFRKHHFKRLVRYNEIHGNKFFTVGYGSIYFTSYVGVIQVGDLVIEVLPKADSKEEKDKTLVIKWQKALVRMLRYCGWLRLESLTEARLQLRSATLLDLYFESFLEEVEYLLHCGLIKQYRKEQSQVSSLKGRLQFAQQISRNTIHRERFFTEHTVYDRNHRYNRILRRALEVLSQVCRAESFQLRIRKHLLDFESIDSFYPDEQDFQRLQLTRKTEPYSKALLLAKMIILNYSPDLRSGQEHVLALLFDMNALFERYVFVQLTRATQFFPEHNIQFYVQDSREFWQGKTIRPDIVAMIRDKNAPQVAVRTVILDTKWKILDEPVPSDADLKQMYAYNLHYSSTESVLIYPKVLLENTRKLNYNISKAAEGFEHGCRLYFADLVSETGELKLDFGKKFIEEVLM